MNVYLTANMRRAYITNFSKCTRAAVRIDINAKLLEYLEYFQYFV